MDEETPACAECLKHDGGWAAWCDECHVLAREELAKTRARVAAVEALLPEGPDNMWMDRLRAAARGEDDQPAACDSEDDWCFTHNRKHFRCYTHGEGDRG